MTSASARTARPAACSRWRPAGGAGSLRARLLLAALGLLALGRGRPPEPRQPSPRRGTAWSAEPPRGAATPGQTAAAAECS
eukprot:1662706-Lingulodinium_polyedra.AAC.1